MARGWNCDRQSEGRYDYCLLWDTNPQSMNTGRWFVEVVQRANDLPEMRAENRKVIHNRHIWKLVSFTSAGERLSGSDADGEELEESHR